MRRKTCYPTGMSEPSDFDCHCVCGGTIELERSYTARLTGGICKQCQTRYAIFERMLGVEGPARGHEGIWHPPAPAKDGIYTVPENTGG